MTRAVGIDGVEIDRVEAAIARHGQRFLDRVFTPAEQALAGRGERPLSFYAGRFAAKEAVLKTLGTGWAAGLSFTDVEVLRAPGGAPVATLSGPAADRAAALGVTKVLVSITHTRTDAYAVALAE